MTPLLDLADAQFAQLVAVSARLPFEQRAGFVQRGCGCAQAELVQT
jgi:hypothetical protein